jgi:energy-coupling factor transporter ATP-binding protein EcfA2
MRDWIEIPLSISDKIGEWTKWAALRTMVAIPGIVIYSWKQASKLSLHLAEGCERFYCGLVIPLDSLPYGGMPATKLIEVKKVSIADIQPIDLMSAITLEEKELMILGTKGSGKSTLAQYLAYSLGGDIKVFEPEGTPTDWVGLNVIGKGEDWDAIEKSMQSDLEHLSNQMKLRREKGDAALAGSERVIIGEEYPEIVAQCPASEQWLDRHARRGRKARIRLILLSQYDRAQAWGLEGKLELLDCFYRLRLTKKAVSYAKTLKRDDLMDWLNSNRRHALLDDQPVLLPDYQEMTRTIQQISRGYGPVLGQLPPSLEQVESESQDQFEKTDFSTPETTENQGFQPSETSFSQTSGGGEIELLERILDAFKEERSDDWVAKNVIMKSQSISYYRAKEKAANLRSRWGGQSHE